MTVINSYGDNAQIAWNAQNISQNNFKVETIATGYEDFAEQLAEVLNSIKNSSLGEEDKASFEISAQQVLQEVTEEEPDKGKITSGLDRLKGILSLVDLGLGQGITAKSQEMAQHAIEILGHLPQLLPL